MKRVLAAAALIAAFGLPARAQDTCRAAIEKTKSDWQAISLQPASKPGAMSQGTGGHRHIQAAVDSMRFHLATAVTLCNEGKDHEARLHLDVVRAFLNLPEVQHPTDHNYLFPAKSK
jgi:hypothetical protein